MDTKPQVAVSWYADRAAFVLLYRDPATGLRKSRATGTANRIKARHLAKKWAAEIVAAQVAEKGPTAWADFIERYSREHLADLSDNGRRMAESCLRSFERTIKPKTVGEVNASAFSQYAAILRDQGLRADTVAKNLRTVRGALAWAASAGLRGPAPQTPRFPRSRPRTAPKSRPLTEDDIRRIVSSLGEIAGEGRASDWQFLAEGLAVSGLSLSDALRLRWTAGPDPWVDTSQPGRPAIRYPAEEPGDAPIAPQFLEFLDRVPPSGRVGYVFNPSGITGKRLRSLFEVSRVLSAAGKAAGVVVREKPEKFASASDLRETFAWTWAKHIPPPSLQRLMHLRRIESVLGFYPDPDDDLIHEQLRRFILRESIEAEE